MDDLIRRRDDLKRKLRELDTLADSGKEKILNAIKSQRWFFFENNKYILFDKDTALIWANLNLFPWWHKTCITGFRANCRIDHYFYDNSYEEVKDLISKQNSQQYGGFSDWQIPTPDELWNMIEDKSFPFKLDSEWCIDKNGNLAGKDLNINGADNGISNSTGVYVIPCSHAYVPTDYGNNISPSNNFYTETEKLQFTLDIFVQKYLIPLFNEEKITQLYWQIFVIDARAHETARRGRDATR